MQLEWNDDIIELWRMKYKMLIIDLHETELSFKWGWKRPEAFEDRRNELQQVCCGAKQDHPPIWYPPFPNIFHNKM